ncbi:uncharacterized protein TM35_000141820 [Trypanosoma theileri]|uniref:Uncharacterized protein n=1 Tax=Trypanosoma theileri TaxID=67003 RepID=A0A1X0NWH8_9TRYP|nr:uncharacterized protein TM35_000141820 [Trypanosoma theileri]ORC88971.1 hypothetical protein TM35_000141820 [Trypanosoma theileri]
MYHIPLSAEQRKGKTYKQNKFGGISLLIPLPPLDGIHQRVCYNTYVNPQSVHRGVGFRGWPDGKTHVDLNSMGAAKLRNEKIHQVHSAEHFRNSKRKHSTMYRKFTIGKTQRVTIYANTDRHDEVKENAYPNVSGRPTKDSGRRHLIKQGRPILRCDSDMINGGLTRERDRVALRLAWVAASRWGEIVKLQKQNFAQNAWDPNAIIVIGELFPGHSRAIQTGPHDM